MQPAKDNTAEEITLRDYILEARSQQATNTQAFYKTCTDFLKENPAGSDDISWARREIEDYLLNALDAHPQEQDKVAFDEFVDAAVTSFSPKMAAHIRNSPLDKLDREIAAYINNGADTQQIIAVVRKLCDVVHVQAELPPILTEREKFGKHGSFIKMVETLPEAEQALMKAALVSLCSNDVIMSRQLYKALAINETKKNPPGTNLVKRGKLSVTEGFAVLSRSHLSEFFGSLLETTDQDFARAGSKIGASSYASSVYNLDVCAHFDKDTELGS